MPADLFATTDNHRDLSRLFDAAHDFECHHCLRTVYSGERAGYVYDEITCEVCHAAARA